LKQDVIPRQFDASGLQTFALLVPYIQPVRPEPLHLVQDKFVTGRHHTSMVRLDQQERFTVFLERI